MPRASGPTEIGWVLGPIAASLLALVPTVLALAASSYANDQFFPNQWALAQIHAPESWCVSTGTGVTVADATSGVDFSQPDLAGKLVAGAAFTSGRGDPVAPDGTGQQAVGDIGGSGTEDAGIIGADTGNGIGIAAVAPAARVLVMRVVGPGLFGDTPDVSAAVHWAVGHGARAVLLNFGRGFTYSGNPDQLISAAQFASSRGGLVVVAAGGGALANLSDGQLQTLDQTALVVGSLGPDAQPASYITSGRGINLWAPGGDSQHGQLEDIRHLVVTTGRHAQYVEEEGSYLAAAHVAGAVADLVAHGMSGAAAHDRLVAVGQQPNGLSLLNLGAALGATRTCGSGVAASARSGPVASPAAQAAAGAAADAAAPADSLGVNTATPPADYRWVGLVLPPVVLVLVGAGVLFLVNRRR